MEHLVHAAAAIAREVKRHMLIPRAAYRANERVGTLDGHGKLLARNFQPGNVVVMANSKASEPEPAYSALGRCNLPEFFDSDWVTVGKSRRETGHGGLVPRAESKALRKRPDFSFPELDFLQRAANSK